MEQLPRASVGLTTGIDWKMSELRENFSARTPNSTKCSGDSGLNTRVNGCPVLLDFRKRVVYFSYTWTGVIAVQLDILAGEIVFTLEPTQHTTEGTTVGGVLIPLGLPPSIDAEFAALGLITHMTGMNDDSVLTMMGVGFMTAGRDNTADSAVIKRKSAEMFGDQDDRIALFFIRAECP